MKIAQSGTNKWQTFTVNGQNTGWLDPSNNYRVEFDYIAPSDDYFVFSLCGINIKLNMGSANEEHHIKIEQINGVINAYLDNNPTPYVTTNVGTNTDASFGLYSIEYLKIKNFVIYPI